MAGVLVSPSGVQPPRLSDVHGHWARAEIEKLVSRGVVGGYPDGTFRPEQLITRAELVKILVTAITVGTYTPASAGPESRC